MENSEIRNRIKTLRNALSKSEVLSLSDSITSNVLSLNFGDYKNVFIYRSFKNEVDTKRLIEYFLSENKVLSYPIIKGDNMIAGKPKSESNTLSKFGTTEPIYYEVLNEIDLCFIPMLACDKNKNRLGYGKGYYDKFLATHPCLKIGLCYDFQVLDEIRANEWDIPLDIIVTETKIF